MTSSLRCPSCGSHRITQADTRHRRCDNCAYAGRNHDFEGLSMDFSRSEQRKWRDPVALSMDGYDE